MARISIAEAAGTGGSPPDHPKPKSQHESDLSRFPDSESVDGVGGRGARC